MFNPLARLSVSCILVLLLASVDIVYAQVLEEPAKDIAVSITKTSGLYISHAQAQVQDDHILIRGTVRRTWLFPADVHGYVQIILLDAQGHVLSQKQVTYPQTRLVVKGLRRAPFSLDMPIGSAMPAQVKVKVHRGSMPVEPADQANQG